MAIDDRLQKHLASVLKEVEVSQGGFGGAVAVARRGELVAQAHFGEASPGRQWTDHTAALTWSVSKGVCAMIVAKLADDGFDVDKPICNVWPEFSANGKADITLAEVMTHHSGLPWFPDLGFSPSFDDPGSFGRQTDIASALAKATPISQYRGKVAYQAFTYGWIIGEIVRRLKGISLSDFFREEICRPLSLNMGFNIRSIPSEIELAKPGTPLCAWEEVGNIDSVFADQSSPVRRALMVPAGMKFETVLKVTEQNEFLEVECPAISLISSATSLARIYSHFAAAHFVSPSIRDFFTQERRYGHDMITDSPRRMALGFALNAEPSMVFNSSPTVFGHPGFGGSLAFGDANGGLGFAYVTNAMIPSTEIDSRASRLSQALIENE